MIVARLWSSVVVPPARSVAVLPNRDRIALAGAAVQIGADLALTQGAGGNLSMKSDGVLWVKASGTRFSDAQRTPIFLPVDLEMARGRLLDAEDLTGCVLQADDAAVGRPSIETAFHALMPHRHVLHAHSVGAIGASIAAPERAIAELESVGHVIAVPYSRPGMPLARALHDLGVAELPDDRIAIVLLGNHGLLVAAPDLDECVTAVRRVEALLAKPFDHLLEDVAGERVGWVRCSRIGALDTVERDLLRGGVLTPDEVVFLGDRPFGSVSDDSESQSPGVAHVDEDGTMWLSDTCSSDAAQIARSFIGVARAARNRGPVRYLTPADIDLLLDWDAEAWRREQER